MHYLIVIKYSNHWHWNDGHKSDIDLFEHKLAGVQTIFTFFMFNIDSFVKYISEGKSISCRF